MFHLCQGSHRALAPWASSFLSYVISAWVCTIRGPCPPPSWDLLHSRTEMEVTHSGNCDYPFPGKDAPGRPQWSFPRGRAHRPTRRRVVLPRPNWIEEEAGALVRPSGSALHLPPPPGARELSALPALCSLLQPDFLFVVADPGLLPGPGSRRRPRVSRRHSHWVPPLASSESRLHPGNPRREVAAGKGGTSGGCRGGTAGRSPGTRGRCAAAQAAVLLEVHGTALATTGDQSRNPESACVSAS